MNKQEALEAILTECRSLEEAHREVPATESAVVLERLQRKAEAVRVVLEQQPSRRRDRRVRELFAQIGGLALYLLRDEGEVVEVPVDKVAGYGGLIPRDMLSGANTINIHPAEPTTRVVVVPDPRRRA